MDYRNDRIRLLDDMPFGQGASARWAGDDPLDFSSKCELIADVIMHSEPATTIGLYGDWGSGKTSLMRMLRSTLNGRGVPTVWFDALQQQHSPHPVAALCAAIQEEATSHAPNATGRAKRFLESVRNTLAEVPDWLPLTQLSVFGVGATLKADELTRANRAMLSSMAKIGEISSTLLDSVPGETERIVVLIDDLDRCSAAVAIRILEGMKLLFGQRGFVFVIAMMPEIVASQVSSVFPDRDGDVFAGDRYLEKMIQIEFPLPRLTDDAAENYVRYLAEQEIGSLEIGEALSPFVRIMAAGGGRAGTPRAIKRFTNDYSLFIRCAAHSPPPDGFPSPEYFAMTLTIKYCWPSLYDHITRDSEVVLARMRDASYALDSPGVLQSSLATLAESLEGSDGAQVAGGASFRTFLYLARERGFFEDSTLAAAAFVEPTAALRLATLAQADGDRSGGAEANVNIRESTLVPDPTRQPDDPRYRFEELALRLRVQSSRELASELVELVRRNLTTIGRTAAGNAAVRLSHEFEDLAAEIFELLEEEGELSDWRHASQYVSFLLNVGDQEKARAIMSRFEGRDAVRTEEDLRRWNLAKARLSNDPVGEESLEPLRRDPSNFNLFVALAAQLQQRDRNRDDYSILLKALSVFLGSDAPAERKIEAARIAADSLASGTGDLARAAGALFWSLRDTTGWNHAVMHNLATVTYSDFDEPELAFALWIQSLEEQETPNVVRSFSRALGDHDPQLALQLIRGDRPDDWTTRVSDARTTVDECRWSEDEMARALGTLEGGADWNALLRSFT